MNIASLIQGFTAYLEDLNKISNKNYNTQAPDVSIFMYSNEFKKYLEDELGTQANISSMTVTDLLNMDVVDGKLVEKDSISNDLLETTRNNDTETDSVPEDKEAGINDILNNLFTDAKVVAAIDTDGEEGLSKDEINVFLNSIKGFDNDDSNISLEDIMAAAQAIEDGTFSLTDETTPVEEEPVVEEPVADTPSASGPAGSSGPSGTSGPSNTSAPQNYSNNNSGVDPLNSANDNNSNLTLEELESKRDDKQAEVDNARKDISDIYSGENEAVKGAKEDYEVKKEAYEDAVQKSDKVSDELKEKQAENQTKIDEEKDNIDTLKATINDKEGIITKAKSTIDLCDSQIGRLNSLISGLEAQKSNDPEQASKNAEIDEKIAAARAEIQQYENKKSDAKDEKEKAETEKSEAETDLDEAETRLTDLEAERTEIEAEIIEADPELKDLMDKFHEAEAKIETVKQEQLETAQANLEKLQGEVDELNSQIDAKRAEEANQKYTVNDLSNPKQLYESMGLKEQGLSYEVFELALQGYNKLEDKGNGLLGIFDTTQDKDAERYYLLDLNTFKLVERSTMKIGSGDMDDVAGANKQNSHATTSGFKIVVGEEYYSQKMQKRAIRYQGLEQGINDLDYARSTVAHYTPYDTTWGCMGFSPVYKRNGQIDENATDEKMRRLFQTGTIIFTMPTDLQEYKELSDLV